MRLNLFGLGLRGKSPNVTAQRRVNCYLELTPEQDKTKVVAYGTPGLSSFISLGAAPVRGMVAYGDYIYAVQGSTLWSINNAGVTANLGTLSTSQGRVGICIGGINTIYLLIVDGTTAYTYNITTPAFATGPTGFPSGATTCAWQDGYFLVELNNKFFVSAINDPTTWDVLDFASAESNSDLIGHLVADHGEVILLGTETTEFWSDSGALDFPYARVNTIEWGLAAKWSVAKFSGSLAWLAKNRMGQAQVVLLNDYMPQPISTPELDSIINGYSSLSDASAFSYLLGGHPMYQINFPGEGKSWLYDGHSNAWSELVSGSGRHRAEIYTNFLGTLRVSDYTNGNIYILDPDVYTDAGDTIIRRLVSRHVFDQGFISVTELRAEFESGVGLVSGQGSDPQAMLQVSKDGGHGFGNIRTAPIGAIGEYKTRTVWRRLGKGRDFVFDISVSDPIKFVVAGAWIDYS